MLDVPVLTVDGKAVGKIAIDEAHLGQRVRPQLLKQAVVMYRANARQGTAANKSRSDVDGSTRKLYRQKGTGNARVGSARTAQRTGGGRAFAKRARDFGKRMPKRMRRLACRNAVLAKILSEDVLILDGFELDNPQTRTLQKTLEAVGAAKGCVLAIEAQNDAMVRSSRNLSRTDVRLVDDLNAYDVLCRSKLVFSKPAFEAFASRIAEQAGR